jgi:hypothetical protein
MNIVVFFFYFVFYFSKFSWKGLRQALETFDEENPKIEKSLNSRTKLIDYLGAQKLYEKNKVSELQLKKKFF